MKKRLLKKVVKNLRGDSPARWRNSAQVKRAWLVMARGKFWHPLQVHPAGRFHYDYDRWGNPMPTDLWGWAYMFEFEPWRRKVELTVVDGPGKVHVSTVFLGIDHSYGQGELPVVFESMVFGGPLHHEMARYSTRLQALAGHREMVERVKAAIAAEDTKELKALKEPDVRDD